MHARCGPDGPVGVVWWRADLGGSTAVSGNRRWGDEEEEEVGLLLRAPWIGKERLTDENIITLSSFPADLA